MYLYIGVSFEYIFYIFVKITVGRCQCYANLLTFLCHLFRLCAGETKKSLLGIKQNQKSFNPWSHCSQTSSKTNHTNVGNNL